MKVRELIEALSTQPQDNEVWLTIGTLDQDEMGENEAGALFEVMPADEDTGYTWIRSDSWTSRVPIDQR